MPVILRDPPAADPEQPASRPGPAARPVPRERPQPATSAGTRMRGPFEPANQLTPADADEPGGNEGLAAAEESAGTTQTPAVAVASDSPSSSQPPSSLPSAAPASVPGKPMSQAARASMWSPTAAKMDQIKDLYLTAEAIGEDALDQHFQLVSERQRQLIREYFDEAVTGSNADDQD
jgi:hypothetical protein